MSFHAELFTTVTDDVITMNRVSFEKTDAGKILYKGNPVQAKLVNTASGQVLKFDKPPDVSAIDYLRLDYFYHFGRTPFTPHFRKMPKHYELSMDIYFSEMLYELLRDYLEHIFKKSNINLTTDGLGYLLNQDNLYCRINIFLADDESGHIIEISHTEREYTLYRKVLQLINEIY
jgi:hypothetical protein